MNFDLNTVGRSGYEVLRNWQLIPNKDKKDLTLSERKQILLKLDILMLNLLKSKEETNKDKFHFLMYLYSSVSCYIDNTDLNKYINISSKIDNI